MLKIRIRGLFITDKKNLSLPESFKQGVFCGWRYVLVHCPYCDKFKLVSAKTHTRIIVCEKCQKVYCCSLDVGKQILVRYKEISEEKRYAMKKDIMLEIAEKQEKIEELKKEIGDDEDCRSRDVDELLLLKDAVRFLEAQLKCSEQLLKN